MSGDHGAAVVVPAAVQILRKQKNLFLTLVGDSTILKHELGNLPAHLAQRVDIHHASQVVAMDENPAHALKNKKDSSMRVAINLVKQNAVDACVSAGNTGALMATARYVLKTLPGIDRPAIISALPSIKGHVHMLDLGANVDSTPQQLLQFAVMGSILTSAIDNIEKPTVGLLNVGSEAIKGNNIIKKTAALFAESDINYVGFIEGDDIFKGTVDVVVCDGFVGNVTLKATEGTAKMIKFYAKKSFERNLYSRFVATLAMPVLLDLRQRMDPRRYNGASLLGLRGIVIKSHGSADIISFAYAIEEAINQVKNDIPSRISQQLATKLIQ